MARKTWLRLDAQNRVWRTLLQGLVALVLVPGLTVVVEVLRAYLVEGKDFSWKTVGLAVLFEVSTALTMAAAAYLHRLKLDPAAVPSAQPPRPPGVAEVRMPATAPTAAPPGLVITDVDPQRPR